MIAPPSSTDVQDILTLTVWLPLLGVFIFYLCTVIISNVIAIAKSPEDE